ncbi:MAG: outer membrane beta-barrel protein [Ferruginibacter sp.]
MKLLPLIFLSLLSITTYSQNNKQGIKISLGFSFSPDYSYRTLQNGNGSSSSGTVITVRDDIELARVSFTSGLNLNFGFSSRFSLQTGLQYADKGYKTKQQDLFYIFPEPGLPDKAKYKYTYRYFGIPVYAKFSFGCRRARFITGVGVTANFLLSEKQITTLGYPDGNTKKSSTTNTYSFNKSDFTPQVSMGIQYALSKKIHLLAEPTYRFSLIKTKDEPVVEKLWTAGLVLGFRYNLK